MEAVTYRDPAVIALIQAHFVPVQVNVTEESAKPLIERFHQYWSPYVLVITPDGAVAESSYGFLPPEEYLPLLALGLGKAHLMRREYQQAEGRFGGLIARHPASFSAPEALYWLGVAVYQRTKRGEDLLSAWRTLRDRYPASIWRLKQSFTERREERAA